jgi:K+-transporting ATPase ATPase C chain
MQELRTAFLMLLALTGVTGVAYPLVVTGLGQLLFPGPANGSLIVEDGRVLGSALVGQPFDEPQYFWGRPSATGRFPNDAAASSGSNLGPTHDGLTDGMRARVEALRSADPGNAAPVPVDLVTASGSGLDPHLSLAGARFQAGRVAHARGLDPARVLALVEAHREGRWLGLLGEPRVNVLALNLALDRESSR